jgi:hypothetical protein
MVKALAISSTPKPHRMLRISPTWAASDKRGSAWTSASLRVSAPPGYCREIEREIQTFESLLALTGKVRRSRASSPDFFWRIDDVPDAEPARQRPGPALCVRVRVLSEGASHGVSNLARRFLPRLSGFFLKNRNARYLFRVGLLKNHSATVKEEIAAAKQISVARCEP